MAVTTESLPRAEALRDGLVREVTVVDYATGYTSTHRMGPRDVVRIGPPEEIDWKDRAYEAEDRIADALGLVRRHMAAVVDDPISAERARLILASIHQALDGEDAG